jgi:hypothetical protein
MPKKAPLEPFFYTPTYCAIWFIGMLALGLISYPLSLLLHAFIVEWLRLYPAPLNVLKALGAAVIISAQLIIFSQFEKYSSKSPRKHMGFLCILLVTSTALYAGGVVALQWKDLFS